MMSFLIVTRQKIWQKNSGTQKRIYNFCHAISVHKKVNVFYFQYLSENELEEIRELNKFSSFNVYTLNDFTVDNNASYGDVWKKWAKLTSWADINNFRKFSSAIKEINPLVIVFTYIDQVFLIDAISYVKNRKIVLDTNDIVFIRRMRFREKNLSYPIALSMEDELSIYSLFDLIITISSEEYKILRAYNQRNIVYFPHVISSEDVLFNKRGHSNFLPAKPVYLAAKQPNNLRDATIFLNPVAKILEQQGIEIEVWGSISEQLLDKKNHFKVMGRYEEDFLSTFGTNHRLIGVNPATVGSGIKIKNIDCMMNGIPVVMTPYAAEGFSGLPYQDLCVQSDIFKFAAAIFELSKNIDLYKKVSEAQKMYVINNFGYEPYSSSLINAIDSMVSS